MTPILESHTFTNHIIGDTMDSFVFALNAVAPIIILVALGYLLKRINLIPVGLAKQLNKIVFKVLLPVMLFNNVYKIDLSAGIDLSYIAYVGVAIGVLFAVILPLSAYLTKKRDRRAPLIQTAFRSNYAIIGIPLAAELFGTEGAALATLLSAASIPVFNILAVIALCAFDPDGKRPSVKKILLGIVKNPLIIGIALGIVTLGVRAAFEASGVTFRLTDAEPIYEAVTYLSSAATPIALLALGAQFEFSAVSEMKREIIAGTLIRCAIVPAIGIGIALLFPNFNGAHFATFVAIFAAPLAVSAVPMSQEMGSDAELAGQLVIWTTIGSAVSIFLCSLILKSIGIF